MKASTASLSFSARLAGLLLLTLSPVLPLPAAETPPPAGFVSLFNGRDLSGWKVPDGDNGHWKVVDGVIDYDAASEAPGEKHLSTQREYTDFVLQLDWRIKETPYINPNVPYILPDGSHLTPAAYAALDRYAVPILQPRVVRP